MGKKEAMDGREHIGGSEMTPECGLEAGSTIVTTTLMETVTGPEERWDVLDDPIWHVAPTVPRLADQLAAMAEDPQIQAELRKIDAEFLPTESDGLQ
jgi:hypothetical protein